PAPSRPWLRPPSRPLRAAPCGVPRAPPNSRRPSAQAPPPARRPFPHPSPPRPCLCQPLENLPFAMPALRALERPASGVLGCLNLPGNETDVCGTAPGSAGKRGDRRARAWARACLLEQPRGDVERGARPAEAEALEAVHAGGAQEEMLL